MTDRDHIKRFRQLAATLACSLLLAACSPACPDCNAVAEDVLGGLAAGETQRAYTVLSDALPAPLADERRNALVNASNIQLKRFGAPSGFELVETEQVGAKVLRLHYLFYQPTRASRWTFHFYRPEGDWQLYNFTVTDEIAQFR